MPGSSQGAYAGTRSKGRSVCSGAQWHCPRSPILDLHGAALRDIAGIHPHLEEDKVINRSPTPRWAFAVAFGALALASTAHAESRGELLYSTHCIACHTSQMHWRDQRSATDWQSLKAQVQRWQGAASLDWSEADVLVVTRYLNETIYRFEQKADPQLSKSRAQRPRSSS